MPEQGSPSAGGRPEWQPSEHDKGRIQGYAEAGYTQEQIAERFDVDVKTLKKHCGKILEFARMDMIVLVVRNLFRAAIGAPAEYDKNSNMIRAEVAPQAWAICFSLKTLGKKLGFTERLEVTGKDGDPLIATMQPLLAKMTGDELAVIDEAQRIIARYAPEIAGPRGAGETAH